MSGEVTFWRELDVHGNVTRASRAAGFSRSKGARLKRRGRTPGDTPGDTPRAKRDTPRDTPRKRTGRPVEITEEQTTDYLEFRALGLSIKSASKHAGVTHQSIARHEERDADFRRRSRRARVAFLKRHLRNVDRMAVGDPPENVDLAEIAEITGKDVKKLKVIDIGNWKASQFLLSVTDEDFVNKSRQDIKAKTEATVTDKRKPAVDPELLRDPDVAKAWDTIAKAQAAKAKAAGSNGNGGNPCLSRG